MARRKADLPPTLIFQHIPKTAGVSVRSVISSNFHLTEVFHVPDRYWRDAAYASDAVGRYRFIHGHLHYEFIKGLLRKTRIVTFVRDPVERVLSLYYFLRKQDPAGYDDCDARHTIECARRLAPDEFVALRDPIIEPMVSDYQARVLLGDAQQAQPRRNWLRLVLANLERYAFVGICDADLMAESTRRMTRRFGWTASGDTPLVNHTARPQPSEEVERARRIIEARNRVDADVVNQVRAAFRESAAASEEISAAELRALAAERDRYRTGLDVVSGMALPLRCWGWHDRETDAGGRIWRCGAQLRSGLELRLPQGDVFIVLFQLASAHPRVSVPATALRAGGRAVQSHAMVVDNRWVIAAQIERRDADADGLVRIEFEIKESSESAVTPLVPDARFVTVALESIEVAVPQRTGPRIFELLARSAARGPQLSDADDAGQPRGFWDPLREIENLRRDVATLRAAREREASEGARYQVSLVRRAEAAEARIASVEEMQRRTACELGQAAQALSDLQASHEHDVERVRAAEEEVVELTARIRSHRESYQALEDTLVSERNAASAYQAGLVERAERSERYAESLRQALDAKEAHAAELESNRAQSELRIAEFAADAKQQREALRALKETLERERCEANTYQTSLVERAERSERYAESLRQALDAKEAHAAELEFNRAQWEIRITEIAADAKQQREALRALEETLERERNEASMYRTSLVERAERSERCAEALGAELNMAKAALAEVERAHAREIAEKCAKSQEQVHQTERSEAYASQPQSEIERSRRLAGSGAPGLAETDPTQCASDSGAPSGGGQ